MTAALQLTKAISRRLKGVCKPFGNGVLSNDGSFHGDCSTCFARCGNANDLGIAETGFLLIQDWRGLILEWACPICGIATHEETTVMTARKDALRIAEDANCHRCRTAE